MKTHEKFFENFVEKKFKESPDERRGPYNTYEEADRVREEMIKWGTGDFSVNIVTIYIVKYDGDVWEFNERRKAYYFIQDELKKDVNEIGIKEMYEVELYRY